MKKRSLTLGSLRTEAEQQGWPDRSLSLPGEDGCRGFVASSASAELARRARSSPEVGAPGGLCEGLREGGATHWPPGNSAKAFSSTSGQILQV